MNTPNNQADISQPPKEFFDDASFKTLYGGVVVTWVATSAIADVLGGDVDLKMLGFIVALVVAFVGFFLSDQRNMKKLVITPFNGLLIYLTIMGGTSFMSADFETQQMAASPDTLQTETEQPGEVEPERKSAFLRAWNPNRDLVEKTNTLQQENIQLEVQTQQLQQVNQVYETRLDSTRQVIQTLQVSPEIRENLMRNLEVDDTRNFELIDNSLN